MTLKVGNAGGTDILVDTLKFANIATSRTVTLSANYTTLTFVDYPIRYGLVGASTVREDYPRTWLSGSVLTLCAGEAAALIAAGKAA